MLSIDDLKKCLSILKIKYGEDISAITLRDATIAFQKLAMVLHPDKAGKESTAAFQELRDAYERTRNHFREKTNVNDDLIIVETDENQRFFDDNFEKFNFPHENKGSFTVYIEDYLADTWQDCITDILGEPKVRTNTHGTELDRIWKVPYTEEKTIDITIHIYNNPKNKKGSKLMLQGSIQSMICSFVFNELPRIYKTVCERKPKPLGGEAKKNPKTPGKPLVKCDKCRFKSTMIQMKMHMKNIHTVKPRRASKRLPVFTPNAKPTKRSKPLTTLDNTIVIEGTNDDSILLVEDDLSPFTFDATNLDEIVKDSIETPNENEKQNNMEETILVSCNLCDFDTDSEQELMNHQIKGIHKTETSASYKCEECEFSFKSEPLLEKHARNAHKQADHHNEASESSSSKNKEEIKTKRCCFCEFETLDGIELNNHEANKHRMINCDKCEYSALDEGIMKKHKEQHTGMFLIQCGKCEFEARKQATLDAHHEMKHPTPQEASDIRHRCEKCEIDFDDAFIFKSHICIITSKYQCERCTFTAITFAELLSHMVSEHTGLVQEHLSQIEKPKAEPSKIKCDQCAFIADDIPAMITHIRKGHGKVACNYCEETAGTTEELKNHMCEMHPEIVLIHTMAQQMDTIMVNFAAFETFKGELGNAIKTVLDNQNSIKQELFVIRNKQEESRRTVDAGQVSPPKPTSSSPTPVKSPRVPSAQTSSIPASPPMSSSVASPAQVIKPAPHVAPPAQKPAEDILYIGDSISANVDISMLESATQMKFVTAKAYSSVKDTVSNIAKQAAKFPDSNFTDVVQAKLKKGNFRTLLLQAGSVDITNLNTRENTEQYMEYFRQEAIMSATNLFQAGLNALEANPGLKKVIIMKQIPRYDPTNVDPLSLKAALSILFNNTLTRLWMESPFKEKMFIGNHNIECNGSIREARYRHTKSGKFDGIHLYGSSGRKAYTKSVLNILKSAKVTRPGFHGYCAQFAFQNQLNKKNQWQTGRSNGKRFKTRQPVQQNAFTVPTQNRFDSLSGRDQGNW